MTPEESYRKNTALDAARTTIKQALQMRAMMARDDGQLHKEVECGDVLLAIERGDLAIVAKEVPA